MDLVVTINCNDFDFYMKMFPNYLNIINKKMDLIGEPELLHLVDAINCNDFDLFVKIFPNYLNVINNFFKYKKSFYTLLNYLCIYSYKHHIKFAKFILKQKTIDVNKSFDNIDIRSPLHTLIASLSHCKNKNDIKLFKLLLKHKEIDVNSEYIYFILCSGENSYFKKLLIKHKKIKLNMINKELYNLNKINKELYSLTLFDRSIYISIGYGKNTIKLFITNRHVNFNLKNNTISSCKINALIKNKALTNYIVIINKSLTNSILEYM